MRCCSSCFSGIACGYVLKFICCLLSSLKCFSRCTKRSGLMNCSIGSIGSCCFLRLFSVNIRSLLSIAILFFSKYSSSCLLIVSSCLYVSLLRTIAKKSMSLNSFLSLLSSIVPPRYKATSSSLMSCCKMSCLQAVIVVCICCSESISFVVLFLLFNDFLRNCSNQLFLVVFL